MKKAVFVFTLAFALCASTLVAQTELEEEESSDSVACEGGDSQRTGQTARNCTNQEYVTASFHCDDHHAPNWMNCRLTSCIVRNGWIVYSWSGYYFGV
jgi:hypothetical protein